MKLAELDNVKAVKYTLATQYEMTLMKDIIGEDFMVYTGLDMMVVSGFINGADGMIGANFNAFAELFVDIHEALKEGNFEVAISKQRDAIRIISIASKYRLFSIIRHLLKVQGVEAGYCRRPFRNISDTDFATIKQEFVDMRDTYNIRGVAFLDNL